MEMELDVAVVKRDDLGKKRCIFPTHHVNIF
ncbi:Ypt/Rab-GAP domain of gyp1p superfamily protein [Zea mays]|jgi:hypothetical protein|uniref:Ypt/Rab-GAP domain of gyp1p superfamily protein n=1 Tax=Zea mays TaxID=4577 RepID=A0A1D6PTB4_MAIZE|nr:Ypt/Rab-GAP domain of gyp1p superfamily protein [Zea mays]